MFNRNRKANYDFQATSEDKFELHLEFDIERNIFTKALGIARKKGGYKELTDRQVKNIELDGSMFFLINSKAHGVIKKVDKDIGKEGYSIVNCELKSGYLEKKGGFWSANLYFYGIYLKKAE